MTAQPLERPRDDADELLLSLRAHRRIIGCLGLVLPAGLYLLAALRPTEGMPRWDWLSSVSAYYYSGAVALFVGVEFALALTLLSYRGYKGIPADRIAGKIGGAAALCVVMFPTRATYTDEPTWWQPWVGWVHHTAAIVLFGALTVFALFLFRKTAVMDRKQRPIDKKQRDAVYLVCGLVMASALLWALIAGLGGHSIFWPEVIAIEAFAISWLVKGEAHEPVIAVVRRLLGAS